MSNSIIQLILVSQPIIIIIIARFFCMYVFMSGTTAADPNVVEQIIVGHVAILKQKHRRLRNAIIAVVISMVSLCVALVGYNLFDPNRHVKYEIEQLKVGKEKQDALRKSLDSLQLIYDMKTLQMKTELLFRWYNCFITNDIKCIDSLKSLEGILETK